MMKEICAQCRGRSTIRRRKMTFFHLSMGSGADSVDFAGLVRLPERLRKSSPRNGRALPSRAAADACRPR
jgi:hypothetical protein